MDASHITDLARRQALDPPWSPGKTPHPWERRPLREGLNGLGRALGARIMVLSSSSRRRASRGSRRWLRRPRRLRPDRGGVAAARLLLGHIVPNGRELVSVVDDDICGHIVYDGPVGEVQQVCGDDVDGYRRGNSVAVLDAVEHHVGRIEGDGPVYGDGNGGVEAGGVGSQDDNLEGIRRSACPTLPRDCIYDRWRSRRPFVWHVSNWMSATAAL